MGTRLFKLLLLLICLFAVVASNAAPNSYPVPGGTAYLSDQGAVAVDPGSGLQTIQFPAMGMYQNKWIPIAVDSLGEVMTTGGGGGGQTNVNVHDAAGNGITSTLFGSHNGLDVNVLNSITVANFPATQDVNITNASIPVSQSGTWSVGRTWTLSSGTDSVSASVSNFPALQAVDLTQIAGAAPSVTNSLPVQISNGSSFVDPTQIRALSSSTDSVTAFQGGSWTVTANAGTGTMDVNITNPSIPVTQGTSPWVVSGSVTTTPPAALSATITNVSTVTGSSVPLLGTNTNRKGLILFNLSAGVACYVAFDSTASPTSFTFQLVQGASYHMDPVIYQGPVSAYCGTGAILVTEM